MIASIFIDRLDGILLRGSAAQICRHIRQMNTLQQTHNKCTCVRVCVCSLHVIDEVNKPLNYAENFSAIPSHPRRTANMAKALIIPISLCVCFAVVVAVCQVEPAQRLPAAFC